MAPHYLHMDLEFEDILSYPFSTAPALSSIFTFLFWSCTVSLLKDKVKRSISGGLKETSKTKRRKKKLNGHDLCWEEEVLFDTHEFYFTTWLS